MADTSLLDPTIDGTYDEDNPSAGAPTQPVGTDITAGAPPGFVPQSIGLFGGDPGLQGFAAGILSSPGKNFGRKLGAGLQGAAQGNSAQQQYLAQQLLNYLGQQAAPYAVAQNPIKLQMARNALAISNYNNINRFGLAPTNGNPNGPNPTGQIVGASAPGMVPQQQSQSNGQPQGMLSPGIGAMGQQGMMQTPSGTPAINPGQEAQYASWLMSSPDPNDHRAAAQILDAVNMYAKNAIQINADGSQSPIPGSLALMTQQALAKATGDDAYKTVEETIGGVKQQIPVTQLAAIRAAALGQNARQQPQGAPGMVPPQNALAPQSSQGQPQPISNNALQQLLQQAGSGGQGQVVSPQQAQALGAQLNGSAPTATPQAGQTPSVPAPAQTTSPGQTPIPAMGTPYINPEQQARSTANRTEQIRQLNGVDDSASNAEQGLAAVQALKSQIGQTYQGAGAKDLQNLRKSWIATIQAIGGQPDASTLDKASNAEQINFEGQKIIASAVKQLGSREAANIYNQIASVKPGLETTPQGYQLMLNALQQGYQHDVDQQKFVQNYYKNPSNYDAVDAQSQFNQQFPQAMYASRAYPQVFTKTTTPQNGYHYKLPNGVVGQYDASQKHFIPVVPNGN